MNVQVIESRVAQPLTDPQQRVFTIPGFAGAEVLKARRIYTGEEFAAILITLLPGEQQAPHVHPATTHAWYIISGTGVAVLDENREEPIGPGMLAVHTHGTIHGLRNTGAEPLRYLTISMGAGF